jgi:hypothetical protein
MPIWRPAGFAGGPLVEQASARVADCGTGSSSIQWGVAKC